MPRVSESRIVVGGQACPVLGGGLLGGLDLVAGVVGGGGLDVPAALGVHAAGDAGQDAVVGCHAGRVGQGDRVVVGVAVAVHLLRIGEVDQRVGGDEPAVVGLLLACADVGQAGGGVHGLAQEALVVDPRLRCGVAAGRVTSSTG